jgi:hypothetical protein
MDTLEKYKKEIEIDVKLDQLNILEKQMILPTIKHKWVSRLIESKKELNALHKKKKIIRTQVINILEPTIPKGLPKVALENKIESSEKIQNINDDIENIEIVIEYLEKVEKIFASMSFDIKTATDLIKMETT